MKSSPQSKNAEIQKLKETIKLLRKKIKEKNRLLLSYKRDWALKLFDDLQTILDQYSLLLKPPPLVLRGSYKNQGHSFRVEVGDIIGLFSKARTKAILLTKPIPNIGSNEIVTDVIYTETGFPELLKQVDQSNFHFSQVSRSCCVNIRYYSLNEKEVVTGSIANTLFNKYSRCRISEKNRADFIAKKETYQHISSLQKEQLRYILSSILNGLDSFTKNKTMSKAIKPADNSANQQNPNKGTNGTNKQYSQNQGNRGHQMNPKSAGKKGK